MWFVLKIEQTLFYESIKHIFSQVKRKSIMIKAALKLIYNDIATLYDRLCVGDVNKHMWEQQRMMSLGMVLQSSIYHALWTLLAYIWYNMFLRKAAAGVIKPEILLPTEGAAALFACLPANLGLDAAWNHVLGYQQLLKDVGSQGYDQFILYSLQSLRSC